MRNMLNDSRKLTIKDVKHVAKLSRLALTKEELEMYSDQLSSILNFVDKLNEIDTESVLPTAQVTGLKNVLRKDETITSLSQEAALSSSSHTENGYFKVKAVIK